MAAKPFDYTPVILTVWLTVMVVVGLIDGWLAATHRMTISRWVWQYPLLGVPIVAWAAVGPFFLTIHFWFGFQKFE